MVLIFASVCDAQPCAGRWAEDFAPCLLSLTQEPDKANALISPSFPPRKLGH